MACPSCSTVPAERRQRDACVCAFTTVLAVSPDVEVSLPMAMVVALVVALAPVPPLLAAARRRLTR